VTELLVGCGTDRRKKVRFEQIPDDWTNLTTLDVDPSVKPDVVWDLNNTYLPFNDSQFDEVHAYECLEHVGRQGDWKFFFDQFADFWRILKPNGYFVATVPMWDSPWAWGDPGHTRVLPRQALIFLNQGEYEQLGETAMTDYRPWWKGNFETIAVHESDHQMAFVLKAIK
jgi:SAM-dependent methyltransferase